MSRVLFALATFAVAVIGVTPCRAEAPSTADERFREGVRLFEAREFARAAEAFGAAWSLTHEERFLWNQALSELNAGHYVEALKHLEICRKTSAADGEHAKQIEVASQDARAHVALIVVKTSEGALVTVDGERAGIAPLSGAIPAEPGATHLVSVSHGQDAASRTVSADAGRTIEVTLAPLAPSKPAPMQPPTNLEAADRAGGPSAARIVVSSSLLVAAATAGVLALVYRSAAGADEERASVWRAQVPAVPNRPSSSWCFEASNQPCTELGEAAGSMNANRQRALGFAVAGGVLGVSAIATWILWPTSKGAATAPRAAFVPEVAPSRLGASLVVRY